MMAALHLAAQQTRVPIQAERGGNLDANRVQAGDSVFAMVRLKWDNPNCALQERASLCKKSLV